MLSRGSSILVMRVSLAWPKSETPQYQVEHSSTYYLLICGKMCRINEPRHGISNNIHVVYATNKASDQPAHMRRLIRVIAGRLKILSVKLLPEHHLEFLSLKARLSLHLSKSHIFENHMSLLKWNFTKIWGLQYKWVLL